MKKIYIKFGGGGTPQNPVNYNVYKTGATTGIDGTDNMGYGDDILLLDYPINPNNPAPQYNRFLNRGSDGMGGYVFYDFSTLRRLNSTTGIVMAYVSTPIGGGDLDFINSEIHNLSINMGSTVFSDWKMANIRQLQNILDYNRDPYTEGLFIGAVFNEFNSITVISSTYMADGTTYYGYINGIQGGVEFDDSGLNAVAVSYIEYPLP